MPSRLLACLFLGVVMLAGPASGLQVPPPPTARVNDYAGLLDASERAGLERKLAGIETADSNQFVVAIFESLEGDSLEDFSIRLAEAWKVGHKGRDNGLLLLIFSKDRKVRIEVGYGLEGAIPDILAGRVIRDVLAPRFRQGDYAGGISAAVDALDQASRGEFKALPAPRRSSRSGRITGLIPFLLFVVFGVLSASRRRSAVLGGRRHRGPGIWWIGPWGGFGGGGSGGGFTGGGGFSGGGGGFGGGGASGGW